MSATSGRSFVMPVSTSTRASGWSMTWTQTGQRSPSTSNSATSSGVIVGGVITNQPLTDGTTPAARRSHRFASIDAEVSRPALRSTAPVGLRATGTALTEPNAPSGLLAASSPGDIPALAQPEVRTPDPARLAGTGDLCEPQEWPRGASTDGQRRHRGGIA